MNWIILGFFLFWFSVILYKIIFNNDKQPSYMQYILKTPAAELVYFKLLDLLNGTEYIKDRIMALELHDNAITLYVSMDHLDTIGELKVRELLKVLNDSFNDDKEAEKEVTEVNMGGNNEL